MDPKIKYSLPSRAVALGFIFMIFFGNLWLVELYMQQAAHQIIVYGFRIGFLLVFFGFFPLMYLLTKSKGSSSEEEQE